MSDKNNARKLPDGWRWVKLGEAGIFESGGTPSKEKPEYWNGDVPFVTGADITKLYIDKSFARAFLTKEGLNSGKTAICQEDTVLIVTRTGVGRVGIAKEKMGISQDITGFRCNPDLYPPYLVKYLHNISGYLVNNSRGATIQGLTRDFIDNILVPLPTIHEQKIIVNDLLQRLDLVEKARAAAQARLEAAKALPAAYLREVFPQAGQNLPAGWRWVKLGEISDINPRRPFIERDDDAATSFIPMEAIDAVKGEVCDLRIRSFGEVKKGYTYFENGDVLFAKITPCMQNGKHVIARKLIGGLGFGTTEFHVLRPSKDIISDWIYHFLRQPNILQEATEYFTGAVGQQRLPQDYLANLDIPLPPLSEQQRISGLLSEMISSVEIIRAAAQAELETINALPAALLRRAFEGGL